jgi:hypothetical protein
MLQCGTLTPGMILVACLPFLNESVYRCRAAHRCNVGHNLLMRTCVLSGARDVYARYNLGRLPFVSENGDRNRAAKQTYLVCSFTWVEAQTTYAYPFCIVSEELAFVMLLQG